MHDDPLCGQTFAGRYRLDERIDQDDRRTLYRGTAVPEQRPVLIEVVPWPDPSLTPERCQAEAAAIAEVAALHPAVLPIEAALCVPQAADAAHAPEAALAPAGGSLALLVRPWHDGTLLEGALALANQRGEPAFKPEEALQRLRPAAEALCLVHERQLPLRPLSRRDLWLRTQAEGSGAALLLAPASLAPRPATGDEDAATLAQALVGALLRSLTLPELLPLAVPSIGDTPDAETGPRGLLKALSTALQRIADEAHGREVREAYDRARKNNPRACLSISVPSRAPFTLRLGLVRDGKVVGEWILQPRHTVWINDPSSLLPLRPDETAGLPARFPLFELTSAGYRLNVLPSMTGRVRLESDLSVDLPAAMTVYPAGPLGMRSIPITDRGMGKISFGTAAVLFQSILPPV